MESEGSPSSYRKDLRQSNDAVEKQSPETSKSDVAQPTLDVPDGGLSAWLVLLGVCFVMSYSYENDTWVFSGFFPLDGDIRIFCVMGCRSILGL